MILAWRLCGGHLPAFNRPRSGSVQTPTNNHNERYRHRDFPYLPEVEVQGNVDPDYDNVEGGDGSQALPSQYLQGDGAYGQEGYDPSYY